LPILKSLLPRALSLLEILGSLKLSDNMSAVVGGHSLIQKHMTLAVNVVLLLASVNLQADSSQNGLRRESGGIASEYYPNGKIKSSVYTKGYGKGTRQDFFDTGLKQSEKLMDNGILIVSKEWNSNQTLRSVTYFKDNRPFLIKEWSSDGILKLRRGDNFQEFTLSKDLQEYIDKTYPDSEKRRKALTQFAQAKEMTIAEAGDREKSIANELMDAEGQECVFYVFGFPAAMQVVKDLEPRMLNTMARIQASSQADSHFGGQTYQFATAKEKKSRCNFDLDQLAN